MTITNNLKPAKRGISFASLKPGTVFMDDDGGPFMKISAVHSTWNVVSLATGTAFGGNSTFPNIRIVSAHLTIK